ncbi:LuxR C-terminal-related transcriptional regulator, partial [Yersinia sp. 2542 StPb PI]|uniref:LuxR C-terminal-related transcriptional regulator n=1 Tax=Yersinia sp. 2542 StPb PI TaxID=3117408 RepID=UPI003B28D63C
MNLMHICKTATVMEIESTIYQCFYRLVTSLIKESYIFSSRENKLSELTVRENQILPLLMFGMATKDISDLLSISA